MERLLSDTTILITGGTSGLGRSLVEQLLERNCHVISIARNEKSMITDERFRHFPADFADLSTLRSVISNMKREKLHFDILINNAGILSPPQYTRTIDGFELSYQVNFLSHVILTRSLLANKLINPECIVQVSSPIHTKGNADVNAALNPERYGIFQAYSNTKLYMALFAERLSEEGLPGFSFDPGTFSSGIYRMQQPWFHVMYKVAAPFMTTSRRVASGMIKTIDKNGWIGGKMMDKRGRQAKMLEVSDREKKAFWALVDQQVEKYLS